MSRDSKEELIGRIGEAFRRNGSAEHAFDSLVAERFGVGRTDLNALDVIQRIGPLTAGELAAQTALTSGAVTAMIDRLERSGYARRRRDGDDRRRVLVEVTPSFNELAWEIWAPLTAEWEQMMRGFTRAQLEVFERFMESGAKVQSRHMDRVRALLDERVGRR